MQYDQGNGGTRVIMSPRGATVFLGVVTATLLKTIRTREDLGTVIESLTNYWSVAQQRLPGQVELNASDEHNVRVLVDALIAHLRGSFELD